MAPETIELMPDSSSQFNTSFFLELESKILCSGQLSSLQLHLHYQKLDQRSGCKWTMEFALFHRNTGSGDFVLVDGTSSGKLNFTGVGMRGVYDVDVVDFSGPRPAVEAGDLFAILIKVFDRQCVVQPFPLSSAGNRTNVPVIIINTKTSFRIHNPRLNNAVRSTNSSEIFSFDARVQLTSKYNYSFSNYSL